MAKTHATIAARAIFPASIRAVMTMHLQVASKYNLLQAAGSPQPTGYRYAMSFEARCQQLDLFCQRLEGLAGQLTHSVDTLTKARLGDSTSSIEEELLQAANALRSLPGAGDQLQLPLDPSLGEPISTEQHDPVDVPPQDAQEESGSEGIDDDDNDDDDLDFSADHNDTGEKFGSLVTDSYGKLR